MSEKSLIAVGTEASSCSCCASGGETSEAAVVDPVCGMTVDPATAKGTSTYEGQAYYFCAAGCRRAFDKNPASFLA